MDESSNVICGWKGCSHNFASEIDMNMHVVMNHMALLDFAEVVIKRRPGKHSESALPILEAPSTREEVSPRPRKIARPRSPDPGPCVGFSQVEMQRESKPALQRFHGKLVCQSRNSRDAVETQRDREENVHHLQQHHQTSNMGDSNEEPNPDTFNVLFGRDRPHRLSEVVEEMIGRLRPLKQLGFIRPNRNVYCIVCVKFVRSFHECNWRHTPAEDRVAEMWTRRYYHDKTPGKTQLIQELEEIKEWAQTEEAAGRDFRPPFA